jgi:hypothetical protein
VGGSKSKRTPRHTSAKRPPKVADLGIEQVAIDRHELRYVDDRRLRQTRLAATKPNIAGSCREFKVRRDRCHHDCLNLASIESILLKDQRWPPAARSRTTIWRKIHPNDVSVQDGHVTTSHRCRVHR